MQDVNPFVTLGAWVSRRSRIRLHAILVVPRCNIFNQDVLLVHKR